MDRYKQLASNTIILALGQIGSKILVIIMVRFYTQILGDEGYGSISIINTTSTLLMSLITLSIGEATIRFGLDGKADKSQVFSISLLTNIIGLLIFIPFVPLMGLIDFLSSYAVLIYVYVFTASIRNTCALFVRSTGHVRLFAVDGIYNTIINIVLNIILLRVFNLGVLGYTLAVVFADLASIIFLAYMGDLKSYFRILGLDKNLRKAMYRFCIPMIPTSIMWWVTNTSDTYFIAAMMGKGPTGVYNAAYKLPNIIAIISGIFSQAWNMSAITEKNSRTIAKFYTDVFNFYSSVIYIISAFLLLVIKPVLGFLAAGEGFKEAFLYTPLLIMSVVFMCFANFMGSVYIASKKSVRSMVTVFIGAALNIILNAVLIPPLGLHGAAIATAVSYVVIFVSRAVDTRSLVFMDLKPIKMITNLFLLVIMGAIVMFAVDELFYYVSLSILFLLVIVLNYRAGIAAINFVLKKKKPEKDG